MIGLMVEATHTNKANDY